MNLLRSISKSIDHINIVVGKAVSWGTLGMVVVTFLDVVMRYLFNTSYVFTQELEWHLFSFVFLMGAGYTLYVECHVRVEKITEGQIKIQIFAGGELVPPMETFQAVSDGTVEMGSGAAYYWAGKLRAAQWFTAVPFGLNAQGMNAWFYSGGGLKLW